MTLRFLVDTNVFSELARPAPDRALVTKLSAAAGSIAMGTPCWHELRFGADRLPSSRRKTQLLRYLDELEETVPILPYDTAAAAWHARQRARLETRGRAPAFVDGQLAAIAHTRGLALVTRNVRGFARFDELTVERW
ncbi:MAG: type II toxin-antitoxin system VapC family toxin [Myxococcota bacterium]|nr:type II toxin-antitoxin system VapC family toxin [Myxococcota bacterium]